MWSIPQRIVTVVKPTAWAIHRTWYDVIAQAVFCFFKKGDRRSETSMGRFSG